MQKQFTIFEIATIEQDSINETQTLISVGIQDTEEQAIEFAEKHLEQSDNRQLQVVILPTFSR